MPVTERRRAAPPDLRGRATITIGIHSAEGDDPRQDASFEDDGALTPDSGLTVAEVAAFHEFGLGVPQRSFIRAWFDESVAQNTELIRSQLALAVAGRITLDAALERIALKCEADVKRRIRNRIPPPLAASTIAKKGSSVPLIDTGQLRSAIRGRVTRG